MARKLPVFSQLHVMGYIQSFEEKTGRSGKTYAVGAVADTNGDVYPFTTFSKTVMEHCAALVGTAVLVVAKGKPESDVYQSKGVDRIALKWMLEEVVQIANLSGGESEPAPEGTSRKAAQAPDDDIPF